MYNINDKKSNRIIALKMLLRGNYAWAVRGVVAIYQKQTQDEQASDITSKSNGVGFNGTDAFILSKFAKSIASGRFVGSKKQMDIIYHKMPKYAAQLDKIAQEGGR